MKSIMQQLNNPPTPSRQDSAALTAQRSTAGTICGENDNYFSSTPWDGWLTAPLHLLLPISTLCSLLSPLVLLVASVACAAFQVHRREINRTQMNPRLHRSTDMDPLWTLILIFMFQLSFNCNKLHEKISWNMTRYFLFSDDRRCAFHDVELQNRLFE